MSDDETKEAPLRLFMTVQTIRKDYENTERIVFGAASTKEEAILAGSKVPEGCVMVGQGPWIEVPQHARGMLHAVIEAAFVDEPEHGEPLFAEVRESSEGGFHARLLTQQRSRMLGWADEVAIMGGAHDDTAGTPGEALAMLGAGLDRVLAVEGWRESFGRPPRPARKVDHDEP